MMSPGEIKEFDMNLTTHINAEKISAVLNVRRIFPWIEDKARLNEHVRNVLFKRSAWKN